MSAYEIPIPEDRYGNQDVEVWLTRDLFVDDIRHIQVKCVAMRILYFQTAPFASCKLTWKWGCLSVLVVHLIW